MTPDGKYLRDVPSISKSYFQGILGGFALNIIDFSWSLNDWQGHAEDIGVVYMRMGCQ